jgi:hypothetical protein
MSFVYSVRTVHGSERSKARTANAVLVCRVAEISTEDVGAQ